MSKILYCKECSRYTLKETCPGCGKAAVQAKPLKYSPEDKYGHLRRQARAAQEKP
jgi:H/ACA ribonucleoprotein complex subunit 3